MTGKLGTTVGNAWTLTRTELRTFLRHLWGNNRQVAATALMIGGFAVLALSRYGAATRYGRNLATGTVPLGQSGALVCSVLAIGIYVGFAGGFNQARVGVVGPLIRTSISPTAVSLGRFLTRTVQALALVGPVAAVLVGLVAVGARGVVVPLVVTLAFALPFVTGLATGRVFGDIARYLNERLQLSLWIKALVAVLLMAVVFVGVQVLFGTQMETEMGLGGGLGGAFVPGTPFQAYASVLFVLFGATPQVLGGVIAVLFVVGIPVGLTAAIRLETVILTRDLGSDSATETQVEESVGVPRVFDRTASTRMAWRYLLRTRRDPRTLAHLTPLLFGVLSMGASAVGDPGILLTIGPGAAVIAGGTLAGAAYCLNPLGDERDQLPLLLTSTRSFSPLLRGRMIAGLVLGLAVALGIGTPLALIEYEPAFVLGQTALAVVLAVSATGIGVGMGALVPKFEKQEYMNVKRAHPSMVVLLGLFFAWMIVGTIGFVLLTVTLSNPSLSIGLAWVVYLSVLAAGSIGGYRYAVRRIDGFTLDSV